MSTNELMAKLQELKSLQVLVDEAQAEIESIKDEIKSHMGDEEVLRIGEYKVTYKTVTTSKIDSKKLKAEQPDIATQYTVETSYKRLIVA